MANTSNKDNILRERIIADFQAESSNAEDLVNLIHILLKQNDKQQLLNEIKDIYEDNPNIETFVDWVWDLYAEKENEGHEETKSDISDLTNKKVDAKPNDSNQTEKSSHDIKPINSNKDEPAPVIIKRSRPAIYDEYERNEKLENLKNINRMAKNAQKKKNNNNNNNNGNPRQNTNNNYSNPNMNGTKPLPPAPKQESKPASILDRIVKPGDKAKKSLNFGNNLDSHIVLNNTKQEKIIKKVKPNPEIKQIINPSKQYGGLVEPKPKFQSAPTIPEKKTLTTMHEENQEESTDSQKPKVRCRNWPNCKNEACQFHHPSENCKNFPACRFGDKCLYIHPAIHCKFGAYCQRPNCAYVHPKMPAQMQYYGFAPKPKRQIKGQFGNPNQVGNASQDEQIEVQNEGDQTQMQ